jgi:hypothetical protein
MAPCDISADSRYLRQVSNECNFLPGDTGSVLRKSFVPVNQLLPWHEGLIQTRNPVLVKDDPFPYFDP